MFGESSRAECPGCQAPSASADVDGGPGGRAPGRRDEAAWLGEGALVGGVYRLVGEVGRGSVGIVARAIDEARRRVVAIKLLRPELLGQPGLVARFRRAASTMAGLRHDNVIEVVDVGTHGAIPFFAMELVDGESGASAIRRAMKQRDYVPLDRALQMLTQAADGLAALHRAGLVHGGVAPRNLVIEPVAGQTVIMDPGLNARHAPRSPSAASAYVALELVAGSIGAGEASPLSDVYAFGATAFELLTNTLPFRGVDAMDAVMQRLVAPAPRPSSRRPGLPAALDDVVAGCLASSPRERFQCVADIRSALAVVRVPGSIPWARGTARDLAARPRRSSPSAGRRGGSPRPHATRVDVVVVDADPRFTELVFDRVAAVLPGSWLEITTTNSGALDVALAASPRLIVAQLDDAELDGHELATALRKHPQLEDVLLVLVSARLAATEQRRLMDLGVLRLLRSPVAPDELAALLETVRRRDRGAWAWA